MSRYFAFQDGWSYDHLSLLEREIPEPGPGEVRVRVRACSLNYRDLMVLQGNYRPMPKFPLIPLSDGAGEVEAVGAGVKEWKAGDRVAGIFMQGWQRGSMNDEDRRTAMGGSIDGMLAEHVVLPAQGLVRIPEYLSFEEASCLPCAAVTAWHAMFEFGGLVAGETVLVQGSGGVSTLALQMAKAVGARVIATSGSDEKIVRLRELGADDVIHYRNQPDWDRVARELTGKRGVDLVVEVGGAGTFAKSLSAVRTSGRIAVIGVLGGAESPVSVSPILGKGLRIGGIYVGSREMFERMNAAWGNWKIRPVIHEVFELEQAADAYRRLESGTHLGKVVIRL